MANEEADRIRRCRETLAKNVEEAQEMLGEIDRLRAMGELHFVRFDIFDVAPNPILSWTLSYGEDGITTLAYNDVEFSSYRDPSYRDPHDLQSDYKWFRRPVSEEQADEIVNLLVQDLQWLTSCSPWEMGETELYEALGRYAIRSLNLNRCAVKYDDDITCWCEMSPARKDLPRGYRPVHWLEERIGEVFRSVCPPDVCKAIAGMSRFMYMSILAINDRNTCRGRGCEIKRDGEGTYSMVYGTMSKDDESTHEKRSLTQSDWEDLSEAIVQADLPSWETSWVNSDSANTMFEVDYAMFTVDFADGWGFRVMRPSPNAGSPRSWDSRCLPIAEFFSRHHAGIRELEECLGPIRQREADLQAIQRKLRPYSLGTSTLSPYSRGIPMCIHSDLPSEEAWAAVAAQARMRFVADGILICDITPCDISEYEKARFHQGECIDANTPECWARVVVRSIRDLPAESEDMGIASICVRMRNIMTDVKCDYAIPQYSNIGSRAASARLLSLVRGLRGVAWNDLSDIERQAERQADPKSSYSSASRADGSSRGSADGTGTLGLPRDMSPYYVEVVWEDNSISFAHSRMPIDGLAKLCSSVAGFAMVDIPAK